jgi:DNA-binding transcriptional LysR family regulator
MNEILEIKALHSLVKQSNLDKAATELGLAATEVEQLLSQLERRLGVALINREGGQLRLTEAGIVFHGSTARVLDDLEQAEADIHDTQVQPSGRVRLSVPVVLGQRGILPLVPELRRLFPKLALELLLVDRYVDLIHEEVDLAIRVSGLDDPRLKSERLCANRRLLVASPRYLQERGAPTSPAELAKHECILFSSFADPKRWRLTGPDGHECVAVSGLVSTNNGIVLAALAEQGLGIAFAPTLCLVPALLDGRLVRVLNEHELEQTSIVAVYPSCERVPARVSVVIDFLKTKLSDPPSWDRMLMGKVPGFEG